MSDFFGETGWDGSLDDIETPAAEPVVEEPAAVAVAEPDQEPTLAAEATPEPEATDDRERDDKGRFVPKKIEVDDPDVAAYLDKYQGDPIKALKAATEAQRHIGSLNNELGQLRAIAEDVAALKESAARPQAAPTQITQELIDQNPAAATALAYEQGNQVALQIAFQQWKDEDPADAVAWVMTQQIAARDAAWAERLAQVEAKIGPVAQSHEDAAFAKVVQETAAADPGALDRIREGAANIPAETAETLYWALENGTPTQKIGAFKALAELTRGPETPATLDVRALAREQALAADEAIAAAGVVSASSAKSEPAGRTMADVIGEEWDTLERPLADGWNIS